MIRLRLTRFGLPGIKEPRLVTWVRLGLSGLILRLTWVVARMRLR
jgi:hypothetical protein